MYIFQLLSGYLYKYFIFFTALLIVAQTHTRIDTHMHAHIHMQTRTHTHVKRVQHYKEVCMYEGVEIIFGSINELALSTQYNYRINKYSNTPSLEHYI